MPILRLAYTTQFIVALIAIFFLWGEIGGQSHLELMPWYLKLALGVGAAFACVKATAASVEGEQAWNGRALKWLGLTLTFLAACGVASFYYHVYGEEEEQQQDKATPTVAALRTGPAQPIRNTRMLG